MVKLVLMNDDAKIVTISEHPNVTIGQIATIMSHSPYRAPIIDQILEEAKEKVFGQVLEENKCRQEIKRNLSTVFWLLAGHCAACAR